jgi:hypothetical protein
MIWKSSDDGMTALPAKWDPDKTIGKRGAVMGGCYVFRRDWYYSVGQPLSPFTGWGCDEEILSIAAWLSGHDPMLYNGRVAHLYRPRPPWPLGSKDVAMKFNSRMTLIHCAAKGADRDELFDWQTGHNTKSHNLNGLATLEAERLRAALSQLPRSWDNWKKEICLSAVMESKAPEIKPVEHSSNPVPKISLPVPMIHPAISHGKANYGCAEDRRICHKCGSGNSRVIGMRRTGRMIIRYRECLDCKDGTGKQTKRTTQEILPKTE